MKSSFNGQEGLVIVRGTLFGPSGDLDVILGLDCGATNTVLNGAVLEYVGYDLALASDPVTMATVSRLELASSLTIGKLEVLGHALENFPVLIHDLPHLAGVDGLLGLDLLRGHVLTLDFPNGELELT